MLAAALGDGVGLLVVLLVQAVDASMSATTVAAHRPRILFAPFRCPSEIKHSGREQVKKQGPQ